MLSGQCNSGWLPPTGWVTSGGGWLALPIPPLVPSGAFICGGIQAFANQPLQVQTVKEEPKIDMRKNPFYKGDLW